MNRKNHELDEALAKLGHNGRYGQGVEFGNVADIDESQMMLRIPFASGERRDGVGDLLEISGIDCSRHRLNPVVLFDHAKDVFEPIALAENPKTKAYTVLLDPVNKTATLDAYFYQGNNEHGLFCEQLFDLAAKRYIRAGSIGYQVIRAQAIAPDYQTGTPQGLHLQKVLMLEGSLVVMPANQDTVRKALCLSKVCGKPLSPVLVKSLSPYAGPRKAQMGYEGRKGGSTPIYEVNDGDRMTMRYPNGRSFTVNTLGEGDPVRNMQDEQAMRLLDEANTYGEGADDSPRPRVQDRPIGKDGLPAIIDNRTQKAMQESIPGGRASGRSPRKFDPYEIGLGLKAEMEHTGDPKVAVEIAMDHLAENPRYYSALAASGVEGEKMAVAPGVGMGSRVRVDATPEFRRDMERHAQQQGWTPNQVQDYIGHAQIGTVVHLEPQEADNFGIDYVTDDQERVEADTDRYDVTLYQGNGKDMDPNVVPDTANSGPADFAMKAIPAGTAVDFPVQAKPHSHQPYTDEQGKPVGGGTNRVLAHDVSDEDWNSGHARVSVVYEDDETGDPTNSRQFRASELVEKGKAPGVKSIPAIRRARLKELRASRKSPTSPLSETKIPPPKAKPGWVDQKGKYDAVPDNTVVTRQHDGFSPKRRMRVMERPQDNPLTRSASQMSAEALGHLHDAIDAEHAQMASGERDHPRISLENLDEPGTGDYVPENELKGEDGQSFGVKAKITEFGNVDEGTSRQFRDQYGVPDNRPEVGKKPGRTNAQTVYRNSSEIYSDLQGGHIHNEHDLTRRGVAKRDLQEDFDTMVEDSVHYHDRDDLSSEHKVERMLKPEARGEIEYATGVDFSKRIKSLRLHYRAKALGRKAVDDFELEHDPSDDPYPGEENLEAWNDWDQEEWDEDAKDPNRFAEPSTPGRPSNTETNRRAQVAQQDTVNIRGKGIDETNEEVAWDPRMRITARRPMDARLTDPEIAIDPIHTQRTNPELPTAENLLDDSLKALGIKAVPPLTEDESADADNLGLQVIDIDAVLDEVEANEIVDQLGHVEQKAVPPTEDQLDEYGLGNGEGIYLIDADEVDEVEGPDIAISPPPVEADYAMEMEEKAAKWRKPMAGDRVRIDDAPVTYGPEAVVYDASDEFETDVIPRGRMREMTVSDGELKDEAGQSYGEQKAVRKPQAGQPVHVNTQGQYYPAEVVEPLQSARTVVGIDRGDGTVAEIAPLDTSLKDESGQSYGEQKAVLPPAKPSQRPRNRSGDRNLVGDRLGHLDRVQARREARAPQPAPGQGNGGGDVSPPPQKNIKAIDKRIVDTYQDTTVPGDQLRQEAAELGLPRPSDDTPFEVGSQSDYYHTMRRGGEVLDARRGEIELPEPAEEDVAQRADRLNREAAGGEYKRIKAIRELYRRK